MRGIPFMQKGFTGGLNTIDSPYTLEQSETRDCLNVVSTSRGAIRKRNGSTALIPAELESPPFPTSLSVTDSLKRTENPLSNEGKWTAVAEAADAGQCAAAEYWRTIKGYPNQSSAYWNVAEQSNPAVSAKVLALPGNSERYFGLWASLQTGVRSGFAVRFTETAVAKAFTVTLERYDAGVRTVLASTASEVEAGDSVGISVRGGKVRAWRNHTGTWTQLAVAADSHYPKGFSGLLAAGEGSHLNNFSSGEMTYTGPPSVELVSLAPVTVESGSYLIATGGTNIYAINAAAEWATIGEGFTSGLPWSIVQAPKGTKKTAGPVYLSNGKDKPQYWTGATKETKVKLWEGEAATVEEKAAYENATTKEHVPNGKYMIFAGNRVWMTGISDDPSAVRFSEFSAIGEGGEQGDPSWWPKNNVVRFDASDGNPITGIGVVGPYILVFKAHKTWVIHNLDTGENRRLSDSVGCVSHRSIVETNNGTFFLTAEAGVYLTNGSSLNEVSYKVRPTILGINPAKRELACGQSINNHYYLSFASGTSTTNNRTLDYDIQLKSWWMHDLAGNEWAIWEPTTGEPSLFVIRPKVKDGVLKAFVANVYTDAELNYTGNGILGCWWIGPWDPFATWVSRHRIEQPFVKKRVRQLAFNGSGEIVPIVYKDFAQGGREEPATVGANSQVTPSFPVDFASAGQIFGNTNKEQLFGGKELGGLEMFFGGAVKTGAARLYALGVAFVWSVGWGNNSDQAFEVDALMWSVQFRRS